MQKDRYIRVSKKWWNDTLTGKWINDDHIHKFLFNDNQKASGTKLPRAHRNTKSNKMY